MKKWKKESLYNGTNREKCYEHKIILKIHSSRKETGRFSQNLSKTKNAMPILSKILVKKHKKTFQLSQTR